MLCNDTVIENEKLFGDPTETALTQYCLNQGINVKDELLVGHWTIGDTVYPVSAILYAPEGIRDDELLTFYAAQETFNDIMFSLEENKGFAST